MIHSSAGRAADSGKLVAFIGSTPNIGTTLVAFGTAVQLASRLSCRVGYLCLNLKSSKLHRYLGGDKLPLGLDSIRAELRSFSLTPHRLASSVTSVKGAENLQVLFGTTQREQAEFFQHEDVAHLLKTAKAAYDICIVDVNAYWDNAGTIGAMLEADRHVVVTTPDLGSFQEDLNRGMKTVAPLLNLSTDGGLLVVTQYAAAGSAGIRLNDIAREAGLQLAATVPYDASVRDSLNRGAIGDYTATSTLFTAAVFPLVKRLADECGLKQLPDQELPVMAGRLRQLFRRRSVSYSMGPTE